MRGERGRYEPSQDDFAGGSELDKWYTRRMPMSIGRPHPRDATLPLISAGRKTSKAAPPQKSQLANQLTSPALSPSRLPGKPWRRLFPPSPPRWCPCWESSTPFRLWISTNQSHHMGWRGAGWWYAR